MKFNDFLKHYSNKIIVLLMIIGLAIIGYFFTNLPVLPQFDLLKTFFDIYLNIILLPFFIPLIFFLELTRGWEPIYGLISFILAVLSGIIIWYLVSRLIVILWNNIFGRLGKEKEKYEKMFIKSLIAIFILITILVTIIVTIYLIGAHFTNIETNTRQNISFEEGISWFTTAPYQEHPKLQEIKIQNNFSLPVMYKLPDVTAYAYDIEENLKFGYGVEYMTEDGEVMNRYRSSEILVQPNTETKIYLQRSDGVSITGEYFVNLDRDEQIKYLEKLDEIILLSNVGMNSFYWQKATEEDILAAEKIKILKKNN